jgi:uroporphyrinogen-III synthase
MTLPLEGRTIALAEGRQLEELAALLEHDGARTLRYPLLNILDAPDPAPVEAWLRALGEGQLDLVILMTGEAVRRLHGFAERAGASESFLAGLTRTRTLTRGPKPVRALKELGLSPTRVAPAPTTEGVMAALREEELSGKVVGLTLYGGPHPELEAFLRAAGATPRPVLSYVYAPATDDEHVARLIGELAGSQIDALVFTSSPQVDRLFEVAAKRGVENELREGLGKTCVAAIGPIVADNLRERGAPVHVCPEQGWVMKNLVKQLGKQFNRREGEPGA